MDHVEKDRLLGAFANALLWRYGGERDPFELVETEVFPAIADEQLQMEVVTDLATWLANEARFEGALRRAEQVSPRARKEALLKAIAVTCARSRQGD